MTILYCYHNLVPFTIITSILISVNNSSFTSVFFKPACHAYPGTETKFAGYRW